MSRGDPGRAVLPALPRDDDGPTFAAPWQAQAFAMAVHLHEHGHFSWTDWATELANQIAAAGPDDTTDYYEHWLATLEVMVASAGLSSDTELANRRDEWREVAATTPHGQPLFLRSGGAVHATETVPPLR